MIKYLSKLGDYYNKSTEYQVQPGITYYPDKSDLEKTAVTKKPYILKIQDFNVDTGCPYDFWMVDASKTTEFVGGFTIKDIRPVNYDYE